MEPVRASGRTRKERKQTSCACYKKKGKHGELFIVNDRYLKAFIEKWFFQKSLRGAAGDMAISPFNNSKEDK